MRIFIQLGQHYKNKNLDSSRYFFEKALPLAGKYPLTESKINYQIGDLYLKSSNYEKSIEYLHRSLSIIDLYLDKNKEERNNPSNIREKALIHLLLGKNLSAKGDITKGVEFYHSAARLFLAANDKNYASRCYNNIGVLFYTQSSFDSALTNYSKAIRLREELKDTQNLANSYLNVAVIHMDRNEPHKALDVLQTALKLKMLIKDTIGIAHCFNNMGNLHAELKNFDLAIDYYKKSLELRKTQKDWEGIVGSLNNIGSTYGDKGDFSSAINFYQEALQTLKRFEDPILEAHCYANLGNAYKNLKDFKNAVHYHEQALNIRRKNHEISEMANILSNLASSYLELALSVNPPNEIFLKKSLTNAEEAYELIQGKNNVFLEKGTVDILFKVYQYTNKYKEALKMAERSIALRDTIYQQEKLNQFAELEKKYRSDLDEQLKLNSQINSNLDKSKSKMIFYEYVNIILLIIILILSSILVIVYKRLNNCHLRIKYLNNEIQNIQNQSLIHSSIDTEVISTSHNHLKDSFTTQTLIRLLLPIPQRFENSFKDSFIISSDKDVNAEKFVLFKNSKAFDIIIMFSHAEATIQSTYLAIYIQHILSEFISSVSISNSITIHQFLRATFQNILRRDPTISTLLDGSLFNIFVFDKSEKLIRFLSSNAYVMVYRFAEDKDSSVVLPIATPNSTNFFTNPSVQEQIFQLYDDDQLYVLTTLLLQNSSSKQDDFQETILNVGDLSFNDQKSKFAEKYCSHDECSILLGFGIKV